MTTNEVEDLLAPELITHFSEKWNYSYSMIHQLIVNFTVHHSELHNNLNKKTKKEIYTELNHKRINYKEIQQINTNNLLEKSWLIQDALFIKRILNSNNHRVITKHTPSIKLTPTAFEALNIIGLIIFILHEQKINSQ